MELDVVAEKSGVAARARRHAVAAARFFRFVVCGDTGGENGVGQAWQPGEARAGAAWRTESM
jgi:hypothetical protein